MNMCKKHTQHILGVDSHTEQNVSLFEKKMHVEVVCFAFKHSEAMPYLQPSGTPVRGTYQWNWYMYMCGYDFRSPNPVPATV